MAIFQVGASGLVAGRVGEMGQIGMGLALMGTSLAVLMMPRKTFSVLALVGLLALGMALHLSEPFEPDLDTRWEPARRHRVRCPECGQQPRAGERSCGGRCALRLADERAVRAQRRSAGGNRAGYRVESTARAARSHTRVLRQRQRAVRPSAD